MITHQCSRLLQQYLTYIHSLFTTKDETVWVFGALQGEKYLDNAKYLFEYVHKNTNITAVWLTRNQQIIDTLRLANLSVFHMDSKQGLFYALRAKVSVVTHRGNNDYADLPYYAFSKKTKLIQLWHGVPLKKIAYDDKLFSFQSNENSLFYKFRGYIKKIIVPYNAFINYPDMVIALSDETQTLFSKAFRVPLQNVEITGYPRNDRLLFKKDVSDNAVKKIIYMPTFRGGINSEFDDVLFESDFDVGKLDDFLLNENMYLDIKLHAFNHPSVVLKGKLAQASRISFIEYDDVYEILSDYSMLLTDYSSIYFDYLLLNRPIIFLPFDIDRYCKNDREFYFDYESVTPGPKAKNWSEVIDTIKIYNSEPDAYSNERALVRDRFHHYQDGNSSKRVYDSIIQRLKQ